MCRDPAGSKTNKDISLLAFFGGDHYKDVGGPEGRVLQQFQGLVQHPNYKRGLLVEGLRQRYPREADARILATEHDNRRGPNLPDSEYNTLVGRARCNINISGLRRSLPFRFCDSFLVGACVPTDELAIRWYAPFEFGTEMAELGPMGYELPENVDWGHAWRVLDDLANEDH